MSRAALVLAAAALAASSALCDPGSHARFGAEAFNCAVPMSARATTVFSPHSFEIDCVALSDAFGAIVKSHFAERLGVLTDFEGVYRPIQARLAAGATNGVKALSARALCMPDVKRSSVAYRREVQRLFGMEICASKPKNGAEAWLRARMDGEMEDFSILSGLVEPGRYAFYDLVSTRFAWAAKVEPAAEPMKFRARGGEVSLPALRGVMQADLWSPGPFTAVRLPMADGAWLYALVPSSRLSLNDIRTVFSPAKVEEMTSVMRSVTADGVEHATLDVTVPRMDVTSETDLTGVFAHFEFPLKGFERMDSQMRPVAVVQRARFRLDETSIPAEPAADGGEARPAAARPFALDRPFLFFIYPEPTATIPAAGVFTGREGI